ncbi:MAG: diguanylate cyclase [Armatimonadota bacterium]|nr:diguanylate cyclase [Armatimonadota bacterium]MDR7423413.1 diguanylate cyclase [Armatimonadota bacterium]MDR7454008.1 diguanylate cyclase [Armatimonadota bacterium]MDR7456880.1 diguanylate cyclase [Armatimonadota bacterium]MDR7495611.1 diguanylate cyclase [Armatimonadota bacterium]
MALQASDSPRPGSRGAVLAAGPGLIIGPRPARVLVALADGTQHTLQRRLEALGADVRLLPSGADVLPAAREHLPDVILLELAPDGAGLATLAALQREPITHAVPVVALARNLDLDGRMAVLDAGAADCLARPCSLTELVARVRVILRAKAREDLLRRRVSFLEELAASDPLTSLLNRRAFLDRLHLEMGRAAITGEPLSLAILDIDGFKAVNDRFGHYVGDDALRQVARVLVERRADDDVVCRYGGEEFVWLLPGVDRDVLLDRLERLREMVAQAEVPTGEGALSISVSIGASTYAVDAHGRVSAHLLLASADAALLEAKHQGKNRVVFLDVGRAQDPEATDLPPEIPIDTGHDWRRAAFAGERGGGGPSATDALHLWDVWHDRAEARRDTLAVLHSSIKILTAALGARDAGTVAHCQRVASTAVAVAMEMGLAPDEVERIKLASLVHDIGKLMIPEAILQKPGTLTPAEWEVVRQHPERGAAMLQDAEPYRHLVDLILYHQESYDGTGYPDGLAGRDIPLGARIIRVADTFDAMTSDRPYRPRKTLEQAKAELREMAGRALDPNVVEALLRLLKTMAPLDVALTMRREDGHLEACDPVP